jgi:hypothetical protein
MSLEEALRENTAALNQLAAVLSRGAPHIVAAANAAQAPTPAPAEPKADKAEKPKAEKVWAYHSGTKQYKELTANQAAAIDPAVTTLFKDKAERDAHEAAAKVPAASEPEDDSMFGDFANPGATIIQPATYDQVLTAAKALNAIAGGRAKLEEIIKEAGATSVPGLKDFDGTKLGGVLSKINASLS